MAADRHLLFGLLALQNDFISKSQLVAAFSVWVLDREQSLEGILVKQGALEGPSREILQQLYRHHVAQRGGDIEASLHALKTSASVRGELERLADSALMDSVGKVQVMDYVTTPPVTSPSHSTAQRFEFQRPLDRGGLGIVSVALDRELNREVALKEIRSECADDIGFRSKFVQEAEVTGNLEHPGIVPVYGFGTAADGRPYYAMRLIKGDNLSRHIKQFHQSITDGQESFDDAMLRRFIRRLYDVCQAIHYAHDRGFIHRDLKPGNIMLGEFGETLVVDWGLAKRINEAGDSENQSPNAKGPWIKSSSDAFTAPGSIVGTASYAPPEQLTSGVSEVGVRSDVYGLGAILFEVLTGSPPAKGETLEETIRIVVNGEVKTPRFINSAVPKPLDAICAKALNAVPEDRYESALELADDLERWLNDQPVAAYPEPLLQRAVRWTRRHKSLVSAAVLITFITAMSLTIITTLVARNNTRLASLNYQLGLQKTELNQQNVRLETAGEKLNLRNRELDDRNELLQAKTTELDRTVRKLDRQNTALIEANQKESQARRDAERQSRQSFATLTSIVNNLQRELKNVAGGSRVRRQMLKLSVEQLQKLGSNYVNQSRLDRATLNATLALGDMAVKFRAEDEEENDRGDQRAVEVAVRFYETAVKTAEALLAEDPDNLRARRDMALAYGKIGDAYMQSGRTQEAHKVFSRSRDLNKRLVEESPKDLAVLREYSVSLERLGDSLLRSGRLRESSLYYEQCLEIREKLAAQSPDDAEIMRDLAKAYRDIGDKALRQRDTQTAGQFFQRNFAITQQLLAVDPKSLDAIRVHSLALIKLGNLKQRLFLSGEAQSFYQQSLQLRLPIAEADRSNVPDQRNLAMCYYLLGSSLETEGKHDQAVEFLSQGIEVLSQFPESESDIPTQQERSNLYLRIADACVSSARFSEACDYSKRAVIIRDKILNVDPENVRAILDLATGCETAASAFSQAGDNDTAIKLAQRSVELIEYACELAPLQDRLQRSLSASYIKLGDALLNLQRIQEAKNLYKAAHEIRGGLLARNPGDDYYKKDLSVSYWRLGDIQLLLADVELAHQLYEQSSKLLRTVDPKELRETNRLLQGLATGYDRVGRSFNDELDFERASPCYQTAIWLVENLAARSAPSEELRQFNERLLKALASSQLSAISMQDWQALVRVDEPQRIELLVRRAKVMQAKKDFNGVIQALRALVTESTSTPQQMLDAAYTVCECIDAETAPATSENLKQVAIKLLKQAKEKGLESFASLQNQPEFNVLQKEPAFRSLFD